MNVLTQSIGLEANDAAATARTLDSRSPGEASPANSNSAMDLTP